MNDERPIEKLLRRYANKRREEAGTPLDLHPATRRVLQGEVSRQFHPRHRTRHRSEESSFAQILRLWRGQWIWVAPVFIVLGIGAWMLIGPDRKAGPEMDLAHTGVGAIEAAERTLRANEAPRPAAAIPPPVAGDSSAKSFYATAIETRETPAAAGILTPSEALPASLGLNVQASRQETDRFPSTAANGQTPPSSPSVIVGAGKIAARTRADAGTGTLLAANSMEPTLRLQADQKITDNNADSSVIAGSLRRDVGEADNAEQGQLFTQAFANVLPAARSKAVATTADSAPLANFRVEQSGRQLRVIDGDGSTYLGEMSAAPSGVSFGVAVGKKDATNVRQGGSEQMGDSLRAAAAPAPSSPPSDLFFCRVEGTNRTLNQQVVFTWNFVPVTNAPATARIQSHLGKLVSPTNLSASQFPTLLNNSFINGRAQLGGAKEIEINAVPVSP